MKVNEVDRNKKTSLTDFVIKNGKFEITAHRLLGQGGQAGLIHVDGKQSFSSLNRLFELVNTQTQVPISESRLILKTTHM